MSRFSDWDFNSELHERLLRLCLDELTPAEEGELFDLLERDPIARDQYVVYMATMHAELMWKFEASSASLPVNLPVTLAQPAQPRWRLRIPARFVAIAASLLLIGYFTAVMGLLAIAHLQREQHRPQIDDENVFSVAVVRDAVDVKWPNNVSAKKTKSYIRSGELLKIESGQITLNLNQGASLRIEGPAEWSIDNKNSATLTRGKIVASVPPQAIGFSIETPTTKVVDLGTEFVVEADQRGATEVRVLKGTVELHSNKIAGDRSKLAKPITLSAGSAIRVEPASAEHEAIVHKIDAVQKPFPKAGATKSRPIFVRGALASSQNWASFGVNNLINGSGLMGEGHSNMPDNTMWLSAFTQVKNEYVLFDLGYVHQLNSMKVWNYNEHDGPDDEYYRYRGVAQADIYVSNTSKKMPLDDSSDWQLVAADVEFEPADGTPDYSPKREISLAGATGRFVAIVIKARTDPQTTDRHAPSDECVGLSEVQFFGVRETKQLKEKR